MATVTLEITAAEIAQYGRALYYRDILPGIEAGNEGRVVAIDVHSGDYEIADTGITSAARLRERVPAAEIFLMRVGHPTMGRILSPRRKHHETS